MKIDHDRLARAWTRLGAGFNVAPALETPDVERLLLSTVREAPGNSRLFVMALTWLAAYPTLVARHRLRHLIASELEPALSPAMGLLLDMAGSISGSRRLAEARAACAPAPEAGPYFLVEQAPDALRQRARRRASPEALRWNLWVEPLEPKFDAIRPASWIMQHNPTLRPRADFKGGLRASILAELLADSQSGSSELGLARRCGVTRAAVRAALAALALGGWIERRRTARGKETALRKGAMVA